MRPTSSSPGLSLRSVLVVQQVPTLVFAVVILVVTGGVLGAIDANSARLSSRLADGILTTGELEGIATALRTVWLTSLGGFFALTTATLALGLWVHRTVERRVAALIVLAERAAIGDVQLESHAQTGPLGDLSRAIAAIGQSVGDRNRRLARENERSRIDAQLQRAFDLCDAESDALSVVERALHQVLPGTPGEVLLADSSQAHLRRVVATHAVEPPGCAVERPSECAAVRRGLTLTFQSSEALDACPKLRERASGPCSAVCSPLNVMGRSIGVMHVTGPDREPPPPDSVGLLEAITTQAGARLGMVRTLTSTQLQASTDALTGLLNRRSFEQLGAQTLRSQPGPHVVVMCDLDHFKRLNDTHGHEAGDRALKLFAETMKGAVRPGDLVGRHGGEEFVLLLRNCDASAAVMVLERLREHLAVAIERYGGASYTASFGAATFGVDGDELSELIVCADRALYQAKSRGRNCVVAASTSQVVAPPLQPAA